MVVIEVHNQKNDRGTVLLSQKCFRSFMTRSNTNCRTALVAPTAGDSIREAHSYEYDNNGNILYVNTLRLKPDMTAQPDTVQRTREEKFRWDEENRLTALSQNGYVSHYWYDADGERTVKMHGGNMAVFVNSERDGRLVLQFPKRLPIIYNCQERS